MINKDIISSLLALGIPLSFSFFGIKKLIKVVYMKNYELFNEMIEQRIFINNMDYDLLNKSLHILKQEKNRRLKIKINRFFKFKLFNI